MKKKKYKIKKLNLMIFIISITCFIFFTISTINIIIWKLDSINTKKQIEKINDIVIIDKTNEEQKNNNDKTNEENNNNTEENTNAAEENNNNTEENKEIEIIEQEKEIPKTNPYWDYIKMNLINVDFNELKKINSSTKGWLQVNGTNINYPFVQAKDNKYYLKHSFDKSYNGAGWVFLDYRNNIDELSKNTIIYAHGRLDTVMFSSLKKILKNGWLNNKNNHIVKLSTEKHNTLWQVFSVYHIPTTSDYLKIDFSSNEDFLYFSNELINRSQYQFNTTINESDKILTLSTCYNEEEKVVLHAKLIKIETKNS